jgi:hypothetical protein
MTSEVVVMNCLGVALASDSAATVKNGVSDKLFNSADKLFMLSKRHPVGVMIYGSAALLGVPWETIIKVFRRKLDGERFDQLEDYGKALLAFLDDNDDLFPQELQDQFYLRSLEHFYQQLETKVWKAFRNAYPERKQSQTLLQELAREVVFQERDRWSKEDASKSLPEGAGIRLASRFSGEIQSRILETFGPFQIEAATTQALYDLAKAIVSREKILSHTLSGVVVAGFGESEHFPVMQNIEIGEVFEGKIKYLCKSTTVIDVNNASHVQPFADSEMVDTFLHGMNPRFELNMVREFANLIIDLPNVVIEAISDLNPSQKKRWKEKVRPEAEGVIDSIIEKLETEREDRHLGPILQAITNMPKDELGHAAARLVSLNWFQKRLSLNSETVGGPVDVAVISKGDGFVWIERKHYFRPELNRHFFDNYHYQPENNGVHHGKG